jgi:hypothetical protein
LELSQTFLPSKINDCEHKKTEGEEQFRGLLIPPNQKIASPNAEIFHARQIPH